MVAHQRGDYSAASRLYNEFLQVVPEHGQALRLSGVLAREMGDLDLAVTRLEAAVAIDARPAAALNELALTAMARGDLEEADRQLRAALDADPRSLRARTNLGALLQHRGHLNAAADCYRQVLSAAPDDLEVCCNLANVLADAGDGDAALDVVRNALACHADDPMLLATQGAVLLGLGRLPDARAALEAGIAANPDDDMALVNLAMACLQQGDDLRAANALRDALSVNPHNARATADLVNLLSVSGSSAAALGIAHEFLLRHPGERMVLLAQAVALRDAGDHEAAGSLLNFDDLVYVEDAALDTSAADSESLATELAALVLNDESLLAEPTSKATVGGKQTGELDLARHVAFRELARRLDAAVTRAITRFTDTCGADHAALACRSDRWQLRAWATVLDSGGHQLPHLHPLAFLSGVVYVSLPDFSGGAEPQDGWLEFGALPERMRALDPPPVRRLEPRTGRLVIFPAYFPHRTLSFEAAEPRISIAFDVMRAR